MICSECKKNPAILFYEKIDKLNKKIYVKDVSGLVL